MGRDVLGVHAGAAPLFAPRLETPTVIWTISAPAIEDLLVSCFWLYSVNIDSKTIHHEGPSLSFLDVSGSEIHQPALNLFESDARVSSSQRMGFDPGGRAIHKLFGSEGRNHNQAKV
jgi:hypothetical protein